MTLDVSITRSSNKNWTLNKACTALLANKVTDLDLSGKTLWKSGSKSLAKALSSNHSLKVLRLASAGIGPVELKALEAALTRHPHLQSLILGGNAINYQGTQILVWVLQGNQRIQVLNLLSNKMGKKSLQAFVSQKSFQLTWLSLGYNPVGYHYRTDMFRLFTQLLPSTTLTYLDLRGFIRGSRTSAEAPKFDQLLEGLPMIKHLNLADNNIESVGFASIARSLARRETPSLVTLDLSKNVLLCRVHTEKSTYTDHEGITHEEITWVYNRDHSGLAALVSVLSNGKNRLSHLKMNDLQENRFTSEEYGYIDTMVQSALRTLEIKGERLGAIPQYLLRMRLRSLNKTMSLICAQQHDPLNTGEASPGKETISDILRALKQGKVERISLPNISRPLDLSFLGQALQENRSLTEFHVSDINLSKDNYRGLACIALGLQSHPKLHTLSLRHAKIDDLAMPVVVRLLFYNQSITCLDLSENKISNHGFQTLVKNLSETTHCLKSLNVSDNPILINGKDWELTALKRNKTLEELDLSKPSKKNGLKGKKLKEKHLDSLAEVVGSCHLKKLHLEGYKFKNLANTGLNNALQLNQEKEKQADTKEKTP